MKKFFVFCLMLVGFLFPATSLAAVDFRSGEEIDLSTQAFPDDLMVAGAMLSGTPEVKGDTFLVGSYLDIKGKYGDDLNAAGSQVDIACEVGDDLRAAGGNVTVESRVGGNTFLAGGQLESKDYSVFNGDVFMAGGMVVIGGEIKGNLRASGGKVVLNGIVSGDATIEAEDFTMGEGAKVLGKLNYQSKEELSGIEERVKGGAVFKKWEEVKMPVAEVGRVAWIGQVTGWLIGVLMMFVVGLVLVLVSKDVLDRVSENYTKKMGWSLLLGLLMWIVLPVVAILIMFTVVGIPLGIMTLFVYGLVWYVAKVVAGLAVGSLILSRKDKKIAGLLLSLALGLLVTELISVIPFVGWLFDFILMLAGMGAIGMLFWKKTIVAKE